MLASIRTFTALTIVLHLSMVLVTFSSNDLLKDGVRLFDRNSLDEARAFFEDFLKKNPANPEAHYYLGRVYHGKDDLKKAEKHLKKAVELEDTSSLYHTGLGNLYGTKVNRVSIFKKRGVAKKIREHYDRALELDENNLDARDGLIQFYTEAPGIAGGDRKKAKQHARILKEKDSFLGHQAFWRLFEKEKKWDFAEAEYKAAINEFPGRPGVRLQLGYFYQRRQKFAEAFDVFEKMLVDSTTNLAALYQVGRTGALSKMNLDRAEQCFLEYLKQEPNEGGPNHASAHWRLGMVYQHKKQKELAREQYQKAIALEPDHEQAKKALKKMK